jgi:hypothetical protein
MFLTQYCTYMCAFDGGTWTRVITTSTWSVDTHTSANPRVIAPLLLPVDLPKCVSSYSSRSWPVCSSSLPVSQSTTCMYCVLMIYAAPVGDAAVPEVIAVAVFPEGNQLGRMYDYTL